jgi:hypothetical protein
MNPQDKHLPASDDTPSEEASAAAAPKPRRRRTVKAEEIGRAHV